MGKIENPPRIRSMHIHKPLDPLSSILDGTDRRCQTDCPPLGFYRRKLCERLRVTQTGKIGDINRLHVLVGPLFASFLFGLDKANDQRFDFHASPSHQSDTGSITTDQQLVLCCFGSPFLCLG